MMSGRWKGIAVAAVVLLAVLWAQPAAAQGWELMVWSKLKALFVLSLFVFIVCQGGAIYLYARLLGLQGGIGAAFLALLVSVVLSVVAAIPTALIAAVMPMMVSQLIVTASSFACGGLAIMWLFKADFGHAVLVNILATTTTLFVFSLGLFIIL
jgi:hypothetical protein